MGKDEQGCVPTTGQQVSVFVHLLSPKWILKPSNDSYHVVIMPNGWGLRNVTPMVTSKLLCVGPSSTDLDVTSFPSDLRSVRAGTLQPGPRPGSSKG